MFGINLFNSLAMRSPLNGALDFAAEEPVAAHREPQVAVVTEPRLGSPVLVAFRWQTKYPRRSPMRGRHWQRQVAKSPRPVFPAYQVNRRSAVLLPSCSGKATHWRFGPSQSLRCQGELLLAVRSQVAFERSSFQSKTGQALWPYPADRTDGNTVAGSRPGASQFEAGLTPFPIPSATEQGVIRGVMRIQPSVSQLHWLEKPNFQESSATTCVLRQSSRAFLA
jgi:hypothetical protein